MAVLTSPDQYDRVLAAMDESRHGVPHDLRRQLALEAFQRTAAYDTAISRWMADQMSPEGSPGSRPFPYDRAFVTAKTHQMACWYSHTKQGWGGAISCRARS